MSAGMVVCSHPLAAQAGAAVLKNGGNAVDAAIATALALCVVDPANGGFGGYGGYMTVQMAPGETPMVVDFNTRMPEGWGGRALAGASRCGPFVNGEHSIALPMVPSGLAQAHRQFASMPMADLAKGAIQLARDGFLIDANLHKALRWMERRLASVGDSFREVFGQNGHLCQQGDGLVQKDLAETLVDFAAEPEGFYSGPVFRAIAQYMGQKEMLGWSEDMPIAPSFVVPAEQWKGPGFSVAGPSLDESGYGIFLPALVQYAESFKGGALVWEASAFVAALQTAWQWRAANTESPESVTKHTTHFCVSDARGGLVSCTFTHGPLWFGSGVLVPGTGVVMNCGTNLARYSKPHGRWLAINNLTPVLVCTEPGDRYAMGAPGGSRIPAIVLKLLIDSVVPGGELASAMDRPRVSVSPQGEVEAEPEANWPGPHRVLGPEEFYGPASAIGLMGDGRAVVAVDRRCASGFAQA